MITQNRVIWQDLTKEEQNYFIRAASMTALVALQALPTWEEVNPFLPEAEEFELLEELI